MTYPDEQSICPNFFTYRQVWVKFDMEYWACELGRFGSIENTMGQMDSFFLYIKFNLIFLLTFFLFTFQAKFN